MDLVLWLISFQDVWAMILRQLVPNVKVSYSWAKIDINVILTHLNSIDAITLLDWILLNVHNVYQTTDWLLVSVSSQLRQLQIQPLMVLKDVWFSQEEIQFCVRFVKLVLQWTRLKLARVQLRMLHQSLQLLQPIQMQLNRWWDWLWRHLDYLVSFYYSNIIIIYNYFWMNK